MRHNIIIDSLLLKPMSVLYGMAVGLRNRMFEMKLLKEQSFDVPIVVVGNLAIGGTGKTPHTEYVVSLLKQEYHIGVLSRGYKRHTKGFIIADRHSTPNDIGDEPYQIYQKFGKEVRVAVCESRVKGIKQLLEVDPSINLIVLDDAFQHRYVKPKVSIVLTEWNWPIYNDDLLPLGRLREPMSGLTRATMIVITKCPAQIRPVDVRLFYEHLNLFAYQKLYFSHYRYGNLVSVFPDEVRYMPDLNWLNPDDSILLVAGIANPKPLLRYLRSFKVKVKLVKFPDHHDFERGDFDAIVKAHAKLQGKNKYIITTEKDAVRMANNPYFPHTLKQSTFYMPIEVEFLPPAMPQGSLPFDEELRRLIKE
ncbi:MAG: tetraacyldisaccharide 4'-kinase [Muribaculum sp.]|nr:tetraacyldisaccharide 4'-kinase [Muribaculaceae bacterium]MCM1080414.1 tetraacyldisaccharide 4'-kinase [Muribaculum sp.]